MDHPINSHNVMNYVYFGYVTTDLVSLMRYTIRNKTTRLTRGIKHPFPSFRLYDSLHEFMYVYVSTIPCLGPRLGPED